MRELGAAKVVIELAEALRDQGVHCDLVGREHFATDSGSRKSISDLMRRYAAEHGKRYDVIDVDHEYFPFERSEFSNDLLIVARSVLLVQHLERIRIPKPLNLRAIAGRFLKSGKNRRALAERIALADKTITCADLVNVSNGDDRLELLRRGVPNEKIVVLPYGLKVSRLQQLANPSLDGRKERIISFVGTFDYRKGAQEFPDVVQRVIKQLPGTKFRLLGTRGLIPTIEGVARFFPRDIRQQIEIMPHYKADELPKLLAGCSAGVFPSHYEGFPFGVLEMLATSLPVVAYRAPGAPMMLPDSHLVTVGDTKAMADKLISWLSTPALLEQLSKEARLTAERFRWDDIARQTIAIYQRALDQKRIQSSPNA